MSDLNEVSQLIKSGRKGQARQLLLDILKNDRNNEQAWLYMAACASTKEEFLRSVQRVLELNPDNSQALGLAQKYDIPLPAGAVPEKGKKGRSGRDKKPARPRAKSSGGGRRQLLLLLLILVAVAAGAFFVMNGAEKEEDVVSVTSTPGTQVAAVTAEVTAEATVEATPAATEESTLEPTDEPTAEPTAEITAEAASTAEPTEESTPASTEEATPELTAEPTEVAVQPTAETILPPTPESEVVLPPTPESEGVEAGAPTPESEGASTQGASSEMPIFENVDEYVGSVVVMAGRSENVTALEEKAVYGAADPLNVVIQIVDHGEPLTVRVIVQLENGDTDERYSEEVSIEAGEGQTVIIPIQPRAGWASGIWLVRMFINGESSTGTRFLVEGGTPPTQPPTPTRTPAAASATPAGFTFDSVTLSLVYDEDSAYLLNLSDENQNVNAVRFVQGERIFEAIEWQQGDYRGPGSSFALQPDSCFQVGLNANAASRKPVDCVRLSNWQARDEEFQFWLPFEGGADTFEVFLGDQLITTCEVSASSCDFALPAQ